jgi:3-deoxy-manno-octulosonate cytidylyltransferase (CMP-KDO synthetase)
MDRYFFIMTLQIAGVIPARYASTRFPGKPLAPLADGRPMIVHVCERAAQARRLNAFWVATDDARIFDAVTAAGFEARMTPETCRNGSDRIAASLRENEPWDILVNIQGDEPRISPDVIDAVAAALADNPDCGVSTAAVPIERREDFESPHVVKVVLTPRGQALYFSRAPLPSAARLKAEATEAPGFTWGLKHLGLYAYRRPLLLEYSTWEPTPLETRECLEQLRFLEHGIGIQVAVARHDSIGVDTPEELEALILREKISTNVSTSGA